MEMAVRDHQRNDCFAAMRREWAGAPCSLCKEIPTPLYGHGKRDRSLPVANEN